MKKAFLFLFILSAATANGQSLKDLLYGGKLKKDSTGVVRKTDDLSAKIDTSTKKAAPEKPKPVTAVAPAASVDKEKTAPVPAATPANPNTVTPAPAATNENTSAPAPAAVPAATPPPPAKSNTKIWKEYTEELTAGLKDVLSSKKVKKESYYFSAEYEIGADGVTSITNITVSPENDFLLNNVKQRINDNPPALSPVLNSAGQPQKAKRRYNFVITKE